MKCKFVYDCLVDGFYYYYIHFIYHCHCIRNVMFIAFEIWTYEVWAEAYHMSWILQRNWICFSISFSLFLWANNHFFPLLYRQTYQKRNHCNRFLKRNFAKKCGIMCWKWNSRNFYYRALLLVVLYIHMNVKIV